MSNTTIRDLLDIYPTLGIYYFKKRNTKEPHLEKNLSDALKEFGYALAEEFKHMEGKHNDIVFYLFCRVEKINNQ